MANDKLHLICGNCGSNDEWTWEYDPAGNDIDGTLVAEVYITCNNCSTLHPLSKYARTK